ncbi:MAG: SOS response-associated peptidase [Opitutaceae bacterium]
MCTRFLLLRNAKALAAELGLVGVPEVGPRYNAAPRQLLPIVRRRSAKAAEREAVLARWGFGSKLPSEGAAGRAPLINARAETAAEKPTFRESFRLRRCVVPADGFYEWERTGGGQQPWLFESADKGELLLLAGLWTETADTEFAVITTMPNTLVAPLHHRMPALIPTGSLDAWLDPATSLARVADLLTPWPAEQMRARPVHPRLNKVTCDEPACLEPPPNVLRQLDLGLG